MKFLKKIQIYFGSDARNLIDRRKIGRTISVSINWIRGLRFPHEQENLHKNPTYYDEDDEKLGQSKKNNFKYIVYPWSDISTSNQYIMIEISKLGSIKDHHENIRILSNIRFRLNNIPRWYDHDIKRIWSSEEQHKNTTSFSVVEPIRSNRE